MHVERMACRKCKDFYNSVNGSICPVCWPPAKDMRPINFYWRIAHGDQSHRDWLKKETEDFWGVKIPDEAQKVEPMKITLTREEFDQAWQRAYDPDDCGRDNHNALAKELGFFE